MDFSEIFRFLMPLSEGLPAVRAILGFILVFFVLGFAWTLVFCSRVNIAERIAFSFGLSIAGVTLCIVLLNVLFGLRITGANALLIILVLTIIALAIYSLKRLKIRRETDSGED